MDADGLQAAEQKMRAAGHSDEAIRAFASAYERLAAGESGMMPTAELEPATDVPDAGRARPEPTSRACSTPWS